MRLVSIVGTRPQLIKAAALQPALRARHDEIFIDTGQHWDESMAGSLFGELGLPRPDHTLGIGGGGQAEQTARMLVALEPILLAERPDAVVVYGDTNSTLAGALAAAKIGVPVAHVEAGVRSFDRRMPEEINRIVADNLSTWLFAPTQAAMVNLAAEGLAAGATLVGDVLYDLAARTSSEIADPAVLIGIEASLRPEAPDLRLRPGGFVLATVHRAANRNVAALRAWADLLGAIARPERPVVLPLHPGTAAALAAADVSLSENVRVVQPIGYRTSLALQLHSAAVVTDSGGIQREAAWLGVPCLILRDTTEWTDVVAEMGGLMVVVGLDAERAQAELARLAPADDTERIAADRAAWLDLQPSGAAEAIVDALETIPGAVGAASLP